MTNNDSEIISFLTMGQLKALIRQEIDAALIKAMQQHQYVGAVADHFALEAVAAAEATQPTKPLPTCHQ